MAGDIHEGTQGLEWAASVAAGRPVIYVPGNHEFYGADLQGRAAEMRQVAHELGIHFLDNDTLVLSGVRFLGSTLWTDFALNGAGEMLDYALDAARCQMYDFEKIGFGDQVMFQPEQSISLHRAATAWLERSLAKPFDGVTVVVTHHCPHPGSVPRRYKGSLLSPAFASDLSGLIEAHQPHLWVHGHIHDACDYSVGATRIVCNPRGYSTEKGLGFSARKIVEV